jgi:hypothetical protein
MPDLPVACSLTSAARAARRQDLLSGVVRRAEKIIEQSNGYRLQFRPDQLPEVVRMIDAERECCRFLRFVLTVEPDEGPIGVDLIGPPGTREFLAAMFDAP